MKLQWKSVSDEQKKRFSVIKERESLIGNYAAICYITDPADHSDAYYMHVFGKL